MFPYFFIVWNQVFLAYPFTKCGKNPFTEIGPACMRILQIPDETIVDVLFVKVSKAIFERILDHPILKKNFVGAAAPIDIISEQCDHSLEKSLFPGKKNVAPNVVGKTIFRKCSAKPSWTVFQLENLTVAVNVGAQSQAGQPAPKNSSIHRDPPLSHVHGNNIDTEANSSQCTIAKRV